MVLKMQYLHLWTPLALAVFGGIMLILQLSLLRGFIKVYKVMSSRELSVMMASFIAFSIGSILLILVNIYAYYTFYSLGYGYMELYRKIGLMLYEILLALGFLILIMPSMLKTGKVATLLAVESLLSTLDGMLHIINIIIILEMIILLLYYFRHGGREMLSGRLWVISLVLIAVSRFVNLLPMQPLSDLFSIFMDLLAFISLYIMKLELDFSLEGE